MFISSSDFRSLSVSSILFVSLLEKSENSNARSTPDLTDFTLEFSS